MPSYRNSSPPSRKPPPPPPQPHFSSPNKQPQPQPEQQAPGASIFSLSHNHSHSHKNTNTNQDQQRHNNLRHNHPPYNQRPLHNADSSPQRSDSEASSSLSNASLSAKLINDAPRLSQSRPSSGDTSNSKLRLGRKIALPVGQDGGELCARLSPLGLRSQTTDLDTSHKHRHQHLNPNRQQQQPVTTQPAASPQLSSSSGGGYQRVGSFAASSSLVSGDCVAAKQTSAGGSLPVIDEDEERRRSSLVLVKFCSMVYAMFLIILGCILHVSELKKKSRNSPDHIYSSVVAICGFLWLTFLHIDLQRYKKAVCRYLDTYPHLSSAASVSSTASSSDSSASMSFDRLSLASSEVLFKRPAHLARHHFIDYYMNSHSQQHHPHQHHHHHHTHNKHKHHKLQNKQPGYRFVRGKSSAGFYLKCGMAAFCFGHVVHEGLRFGQHLYFFFTDNQPCQDPPALVAHLVTPLYSFYQLFMMFKYSNLVINRNRALAYFGLMHVIGTSIAFWFRTIIEEAFDDYVSKMNYLKTPHYALHRKQIINSTSTTNRVVNHADLVSSSEDGDNESLSKRRAFLQAPVLSLFRDQQPYQEQHDPLEPPEVPRNEDPLSESSAETPPASMHLESPQPLADEHQFGRLQGASSNVSANIISPVAPHVSIIGPRAGSTMPDFYACSQDSLLTTKSLNALPYLYPFTIEYNLLIAATFLGLYFNVGKLASSSAGSYTIRPTSVLSGSRSVSDSFVAESSASKHLEANNAGQPRQQHQEHLNHQNSDNHHSQLPHSFQGSPPNSYSQPNLKPPTHRHSQHHLNHPHHHYQLYEGNEFKSNFVVSADCHAANRGLFAGFFTLLVTLVSIVIFFVSIGKVEHVELGVKINVIQRTALTLLILIVVAFGSLQTRRLNKNPCLRDTMTTNDVLILVPLPFFFAHSLLSIRAEYHTVNVPLSQISAFKWLAIGINLITVIEVLAQTIFIIDGLRRCSQSKYLRFKKPGRELLTFCVILNITFWIVATFESKSVEQYHVEIDYYGPLSWQFVSHTTLPVMLFYRYHSSVCLAEIWNRAYKPAKLH